MGIAAALADNDRLRQQLAARDEALASQSAELASQAALLAELTAKLAAVTASNEDLARQLELIRLKLQGRKSERFVDDATLPLPFGFGTPQPPPRLPEPEPAAPEPPAPPAEAPAASPKAHPRRRTLGPSEHRPTRPVRCAIDPAACCGRCGKPLKVFGTSHSYRLECTCSPRPSDIGCPQSGVQRSPRVAMSLWRLS